MECICDQLDEVMAFLTWDEFLELRTFIEKLIKQKEFERIGRDNAVVGITTDMWLRCCICGTKWILSIPDYPYHGLFSLAENSQLMKETNALSLMELVKFEEKRRRVKRKAKTPFYLRMR